MTRKAAHSIRYLYKLQNLVILGLVITVIALVTALLVIAILVTIGLNFNKSNFPVQAITRSRCQVDQEFIFIPAGNFIAGSNSAERDYAYRISAIAAASKPELVTQAEQQLRNKRWFAWESPQQVLSLPAFCISRNLVTNAEYQAFVKATGYPIPGISEKEYQQQGFLVHSYSAVKPFLWQNGNYPPGEANYPVVLVSYEDALAFAAWRGQQDNYTYSLPSAQQWEKAARGTNGSYFPWGNQWQAEATNWSGSGKWHTSAIASYPLSRSPYGVEDMAGNVFEYTSTLGQFNLKKAAVMKGCSWDDLPGFCRGAYQHTRPIQSRHILFGFRLVRE
ncbi:MAG: formylglycine-generating enzyme family protein [Symploca sp. SIO2E9]|nr:formylglycine-generating enzyme family protein [Symploca sp. SIO2E9]